MYLHDISCVFRTFICYILPLVTTAFYPRKGKIRENFYIETSHSRYKKLNATYLALHLGSYYKQNYHNGHSSCIFFHLALSHMLSDISSILVAFRYLIKLLISNAL